MKDLAWKVLSRRYLIEDGWFTLRKDTCRLPGGEVIEDYYVVEYRPWVSVVALTARGEVVLERQYRHGIGLTALEFPGGVIDPEDESPEAAARRELLEETGYGSGEFIQTGIIYPEPGHLSNRMVCFLATGVQPLEAQRLEATEALDVLLLPLDEVVRRAQTGEFAQALHVSALFFALSRMGKI